MNSSLRIKLAEVFHQKIGLNLILSYVFFLICMSLDFYITNVSSQGDWTMEANTLARMWWQIMGPFRFIEIPIWAALVFCAVYLVNSKSKFFALLWLNMLALNHLQGFITWLPYGTLDFLYVLDEWMIGYAIGIISIFLSIPLTIVQTTWKRWRF